MNICGGDHLIWQAHDLALLGLALEPVLDCASAWRIKALEILKAQVNRQFYPDGINFELSIGYQVFVTKLIGEIISSFWKSGRSLPPQIIWRFKQSINVLDLLTRPYLRLPLYGDFYPSHDPNLELSIDEAIQLLTGLHERLFLEGTHIPKNDLPILPWLMDLPYIWDKGEKCARKGHPALRTRKWGRCTKSVLEGYEFRVICMCAFKLVNQNKDRFMLMQIH